MPRTVVVGGGIAGVSVVTALREGGCDDELVLLEAGDLPYDRPPLSKDYLAGTATPDDLVLRPASWYDEQRVELRLHTPVARVRAEAGGVELADGSLLRADHVVLATGGRAARPDLGSERVHTLRTREDADALREALRPGTRLLVVGGGLVGAEVASAATGMGVEVTLVDPLPAPLADVLGAELAALLHAQHAEHGVTVRQAGVRRLHDDGPVVRAELDDGSDLAAESVLVSVGMRPETLGADPRGLEVDAEHRSAVSHVLAVGDAARLRGQDAPTGHWDAAVRHGARVAATLLGTPAPADEPSWFWSDRHGHHVEVVGHPARADRVVHRGEPGSAAWSSFAMRDGELVGALAVDDAKAVRAARRLMARGVVVDPEALADPATDLRRLVRG